MKTLPITSCCLAGLAVLWTGNVVTAAPFVPSSLNPGDPYHLVFVTNGTRDGTSSLIGDYDTFVNNQAAQNPALTGTSVGVQYSVIGSTTGANAITHAPITAPVYNFNGDLIALNSADMYDGALANPILYDQFAAIGFPDVYTGSNSAGVVSASGGLGDPTPRSGLANSATASWIDDSVFPQATPASFYGLSQPLTVPGVVPEPSSAALWMLLGVSAYLARRRGSGA